MIETLLAIPVILLGMHVLDRRLTHRPEPEPLLDRPDPSTLPVDTLALAKQNRRRP